VLAGFSGTPAEEMPHPAAEKPKAQAPIPEPRRKKASDAQKKMLKAASYIRAERIECICATNDLPLKHQERDVLAASIRKHALLATGIVFDDLKFDEVDPLKDAIEKAETNADGEVVIPSEEF
jgi:hypothetical protein